MPSAFPPPASRTIDKTTARRFTLAHHHLWPPRKLNGKKGVIEYIRHIGSIQFDPINIVGRNPDLVLQARVKDYRPVMLDELLYKDQQLLDGWDKMASIYCLADWPNFARRRALMNKYHGDPDNIVMQVAPDVLGQIEEKGPLSPLDFKGYKKIEWSWGPTKASRASLEGLFEMGQLGVHHRVNNRRYFDLIERLISGELLAAPDPNQSDEHYQDWHILRRVGAMGLALPNAGEHWHGIIGVKTPQRKQIISRLVERGELVAIAINEIPDKIYFMRNVNLPTLDTVQKSKPRSNGAAILGPLDNLLWNRKNNAWLFDFEYIWEVYKPKAIRQYGYYTLPVVYGDRFIARFDPSFDKKTRHLTIQNWWWEKNIELDEEMQAALIECFIDFRQYLEAEKVNLGDAIEKNKSLRWMEKLGA